ncbi:hypothetical protein WJX72_000220 [[Myrmecia] bisecta]|uniref:TRUD domain-containing protein n=1 Tax=[Myrmecia] bisecta TaxID=41462 RepID=A0AAW1PK53_9CHLO
MQRKAIHDFFKTAKALPAIASDTVQEKGAESGMVVNGIRLSWKPPKGKKRKQPDTPDEDPWETDWPGHDKLYCRFSMYKENTDTQAALTVLARYLHCGTRNFAVAGTKDKRAVTVQQVTVQKVTAARLCALNDRLRGICLGDFEYVEKPLWLGGSAGNLFEITLRQVEGATACQLAAAADALREQGFINYFGLQRFGAGAIGTHRVGAKLLRGEWREAVELIMQPKDAERAENVDARQLYLQKGDIHGPPQHAHDAPPQPEHQSGELDADMLPEDGWGASRLASVHVVTPEEAATEVFSIEDVVLPLPGKSVQYPQHETAAVYGAKAKEHGVSLDSVVHAQREYSLLSLPGDYRRVLHKPRDLEWKLLQYSNALEALAATELEAFPLD